VTKTQATKMVKRINASAGEDVARVYEGYSGRCMYGDTTTGVVAPDWALPKGASKRWRQDSMGLGTIIY